MKYLKAFRLFENNDDIKKIIDLFLSNDDKNINLAFYMSSNYDSELIADEIVKRLNIEVSDSKIDDMYSKCLEDKDHQKEIIINKIWNDYQIYFKIYIDIDKETSSAAVNYRPLLPIQKIVDFKRFNILYQNGDVNKGDISLIKKSINDKVMEFNNYINTEFKKIVINLLEK